MKQWPRAALVTLTLFLGACSGGSGGGGSERPVDVSAPAGSSEFVYNGPPPASDDIQSFKVSVYDALAGNDRCGQCHSPGGTGNNHFVDQTNVNNAWQEARQIVSFADPAASELVQRVADGHQCWLGQEQVATCATTIVGYIERWAASGTQSASAVKLLPRIPISPDGTQVLPPQLSAVTDLGLDLAGPGELLELLSTYCSECHADIADVPQLPFFASADPAIAYAALRGKVSLSNPESSRLVLRLSPEAHNCWSDCGDDAATMTEAIARFSEVVPVTQIDPELLISTAQVLERDGIIATSGGRFEADLIAKWEFREGKGNTTADTSGVPPEIPLTLSGQYAWQAGWGIRFVNGKAQGGVNDSAKLFEKLTATGEYTLEAWVAPANVSQEEAWIAAYAGGPESRNMLLSQSLYNYEAFTRSTVTEDNNGGAPALVTDDDAELAQASLQHVVVTFDPVQGRRIYVNGEYSGDVDAAGGGLLNNWSEAYAVVLGNTTSNSNPWAGTVRMLAIHSSALSPEQILNNFDIGVGQKYFLLFSVSELLEDEGACSEVDGEERTNYCYVVFEVSQFDAGSYLFNTPFFVNLNPEGGDVSFDLKGIRLGINGKLAEVGQAFVNVDAAVSGGNLGAEPEPLASIGSIIALENGADTDLFFLAFDEIGGSTGAPRDGAVNPFGQTLRGTAAPDVAMRTFDEVNATLSVLTGVPVASTSVSQITGKTVAETYQAVRRALPGVPDFQAYMSSHQMAATQLTAAYCDALVQSEPLRQALFPAAFDFARPVADPGIDWEGQVVTPLVDRAINSGLLSHEQRARILEELVLLITDDRDLKPYRFVNGSYVSEPDGKRDGLIFCRAGQACPSTRTADVVKATCTAVLGSALVLMQ